MSRTCLFVGDDDLEGRRQLGPSPHSCATIKVRIGLPKGNEIIRKASRELLAHAAKEAISSSTLIFW